MLTLFGEWTWAFLLFVGTVLAVLGWGLLAGPAVGVGDDPRRLQHRRAREPLAGQRRIPQGWVAGVVEAAVVVYAA
jgi:hypothetical protein